MTTATLITLITAVMFHNITRNQFEVGNITKNHLSIGDEKQFYKLPFST